MSGEGAVEAWEGKLGTSLSTGEASKGGVAVSPGAELVRSDGAIARGVLVAVVTAVAYQLGYLFFVEGDHVSAVWPATGLALGIILGSPRAQQPALAGVLGVVGFVTNVVESGQVWMSVGFVASNLLALFIVLLSVERASTNRPNLREVNQTTALIAAVAIGGAFAATVGAGSAALTTSASFASSYRTWWTSEALGILLFAPLVVAWSPSNASLTPRRSAAEIVAFFVLWVLAAWLVFWVGEVGGSFIPSPYLLIAILTWAALRFDLRWVTVALVTLAVIALATVFRAGGAFPLLGADVADRVFAIQVYLAIASISSLLLSASRSETLAAAAAWREERMRLRAIGDNLPDGVVYQVVREHDGAMKFLHISSGIEQMMGVPLDAIVANPQLAYARMAPDERKRFRQAEVESAETLRIFRFDARIEPVDGGERWITFASTPRRLPDGRTLWDGIVVDITERHRAQERLTQANEALRKLAAEMTAERHRSDAIIRSAMDGIITADEHGRILLFNPVAERMFGCDAMRARGEPLERFIPWRQLVPSLPEGDAAEAPDSDRPPTSTEGHFGTVTGSRADGRTFPLEASVCTVEVENARIHTVTCRDLTDRHRAEEHLREIEHQFRQAQKMEAFGQLAGGVAHDFNNFLMAIMMQAEIAERKPGLPSSVRESLDGILESATRASNLTRQLLMFGRKQVLQFRTIDLNDVVSGMSKMLVRVLPENVEQDVRLGQGPLRVQADAGMLDQILLNLAVNARDAMPSGGRLTIETTELVIDQPETHGSVVLGPGRYACFRVRDTGTGIPPEHVSRIFEPFFTTKETGKGTGLGLATVYGIVQQHAGAVNVSSELGHGSTFEVFLPATEDEAERADATRPRSAERGGSETILVVEDDPRVRASSCAALEAAGYRVFPASDGEEALGIWREHSSAIDLLMTDVVMPASLSGLALAERLTAERADLRTIFLSGYAAEIAGTELELTPRQRFLQKPCSMQQLLDTVRDCLDEGR